MNTDTPTVIAKQTEEEMPAGDRPDVETFSTDPTDHQAHSCTQNRTLKKLLTQKNKKKTLSSSN
jgi:hypothetical protein